jgi:hypothetical protein
MYEPPAGRPHEEEADANHPRIPDPAEQARAQAGLDQFHAELRAAEQARATDPPPFDPVQAERWRQRCDVMGTDPYPDHLYDGAGNIVYTRRPDGWYDNDDIRRFDLVMRPVGSPGAQ